MTLSRLIAFPARRPWVPIGAALAVAVAIWAIGTRTQPYHVRAAFTAAVSLTTGLDVRVDGVNVGKVSSVDYGDGEAIVGIGISDRRIYPLHRGTRAIIRFGTTVGNGTRRVDLVLGPGSAPAIPNGGIIPIEDTVSPVEFDQVFSTLDRATRARMRHLFADAATELSGHAPELNAGLHAAPGAVAAAGGVMSDLAGDTAALQGLIANADRATTTLAARQPELENLISVAARTFGAFAARTDKVRQAIDGFAPTLSQTRSTLVRLDSSVNTLDGLVGDLAPGAVRLRSLAHVAGPTLSELERVAPLALNTLRVGIAAAPPTTAFLARAQPFMQQLSPVLARSSPMLACIRPYAPELAGWASTWASMAKNQDGSSHYGRIHAIEGYTSLNGAPLTSAQLVAASPGLTYAFPRPPGLNAGRPQFIPACGYTPSALNPADDPEARP